jgi:hypothetical protein
MASASLTLPVIAFLGWCVQNCFDFYLGILKEEEKFEKRKRNAIVGNADIITDVDGNKQ